MVSWFNTDIFWTISPQELVLSVAICFQIAAVYQQIKLAHWSGYIRPFQLYGACFILMIFPRLFQQARLWGYFPKGVPVVASITILSFLVESILLFYAGKSLRRMIKRDIGNVRGDRGWGEEDEIHTLDEKK